MVPRRMASRAWLLIVVAVLCTSIARVHAQASGLGPWEQSQFRLDVSPLWPTSDGTTYGNVGNSLYRSDDNGMTFTKVTLPGPDNARVVAVDPHDRNHLYVATDAVYRSDDGGATLSVVYPLAPTTRGTEANPQARLQTSELIGEMVGSAVDRQLLYMQLLTVGRRAGDHGGRRSRRRSRRACCAAAMAAEPGTRCLRRPLRRVAATKAPSSMPSTRIRRTHSACSGRIRVPRKRTAGAGSGIPRIRARPRRSASTYRAPRSCKSSRVATPRRTGSTRASSRPRTIPTSTRSAPCTAATTAARRGRRCRSC